MDLLYLFSIFPVFEQLLSLLDYEDLSHLRQLNRRPWMEIFDKNPLIRKRASHCFQTFVPSMKLADIPNCSSVIWESLSFDPRFGRNLFEEILDSHPEITVGRVSDSVPPLFHCHEKITIIPTIIQHCDFLIANHKTNPVPNFFIETLDLAPSAFTKSMIGSSRHLNTLALFLFCSRPTYQFHAQVDYILLRPFTTEPDVEIYIKQLQRPFYLSDQFLEKFRRVYPLGKQLCFDCTDKQGPEKLFRVD